MLRLVMMLLLFPMIFSVIYAQESDLPEELGTAQGVHKIHLASEEIPTDFRNVAYIYFKKKPGTDTSNPPTDGRGRVSIMGELKLQDGTTFKFETAHFHRISNGDYRGIDFKTMEIHGVWYSFSGEFLEKKIYDQKLGGYTRIRGTLEKHKDEKIAASSNLPFFQYAEL